MLDMDWASGKFTGMGLLFQQSRRERRETKNDERWNYGGGVVVMGE